MIYDVSNHWLLSAKAAALEPKALEAKADTAEDVLGLAGTAFTGADADKAKRAVVYWINCQLGPDDGSRTVKSRSKSKGGQSESITYADHRDEKLSARLADPCQMAQLLARQLVGPGTFNTLTSVR